MGAETKRYNFSQEQSGLSKKDFAVTLGMTKSHEFRVSSNRARARSDRTELDFPEL
jgi:hypothetical protein